MKICINVIATGKYIEFVPQLIYSIDKYFLIGHDITVNVFTDSDSLACVVINTTRLYLIQHKIPSYKFPEATLLRYHIMLDVDYDCDYIFYLDADMRIVDYVGDEILGDLVAVRHPGYYIAKNAGAWETRAESLAYIKPEDRKKYFCGGVQGGSKDYYTTAMIIMSEWIDIDLKAGVMPVFHDESILNKFLISREYKELSCAYCIPEAMYKRRYSKIEHIKPKILALEKDFNYFRN